MLVHIGYRFTSEYMLERWNSGGIPFEHALRSNYESCTDVLSDDLYEKYRSFIDLYTTSNVSDFVELEADKIPARTSISGQISFLLDKENRHKIHFEFMPTTQHFLASKQYSSVSDLLFDLYSSYNKDLRQKHVQNHVAAALSSLLDELYHDVVNPDLENILNLYASKLLKIISPYADQLKHIRFKQCGFGEVLPEGNFVWRNDIPLQWNIAYLLYYLTQGFSYFRQFPVLLWSDTPPKLLATAIGGVSNLMDLSFLQTRALELTNTRPGKISSSGHLNSITLREPPKPIVSTPIRLAELKSYNSENSARLSPEVLNLIWHVSVVFEYIERVYPDKYEWSYQNVNQFICDVSYREKLIQLIPFELFGFDTPIDHAIQYLECGSFAKDQVFEIDKNALFVLRWYFNISRITGKKLSTHFEPVTDWRMIESRQKMSINNPEYKFSTYYTHLQSSGIFRFFTPVVSGSLLEPLYTNYPNFNEVTSWVERMLALLHRSKDKVLSLPPILISGPPGLGKTRYLNALSRILSSFVHEYSMSTMSAGFIFSGIDSTWKGSKAGQIADILLLDDCINPIIILDEIDKSLSGQYDPYGPLYMLLEKHTASRFRDEYLEVTFNASFINWFATANNLDVIPEPIRNRFRIFNIPSLKKDDIAFIGQSVYRDILQSNNWGHVFAPDLPRDVIESLACMDVRSIRFALLEACSSAADRCSDSILTIEVNDLPKSSSKRAIGFIQ